MSTKNLIKKEIIVHCKKIEFFKGKTFETIAKRDEEIKST
jgi:hypothetical protein